MRQQIGLGQIRNNAAYYFDRVAAGESFDVVRRGRLVAQIIPLVDDRGEGAEAAGSSDISSEGNPVSGAPATTGVPE